jgi:hypothetical protein
MLPVLLLQVLLQGLPAGALGWHWLMQHKLVCKRIKAAEAQ